MVVTLGRGVAHLTFEPQSAERWLMAGDRQTGHTSVHLERGLCLDRKTACAILLIADTAENDRSEVWQ